MSIEIEADFINKANVDGRYQIDRDKFSHVSLQVKNLLELQMSCLHDKDKLIFFIENHKILVTYDDDSNGQDDFDRHNIEQVLINGLEETIKKAHQYHELIEEEGVGPAKEFNFSNNELPAKAADLLSKLEENDIKLVTENASVKLSKIRKIAINNSTYKKMLLEGCRITKPELIGTMVAEFWATIDKKKVIARLIIPREYVKLVCDMAFNKKKVDIEFEYSENLKKSNRYNGTLTSIKASKIIDTNIELDF